VARGTVRGALSAALALSVLQAVVSRRGSGAVAGAFGVVDGLVQRALDPDVPAIRDRRDPLSSLSPSAAAGQRAAAAASTPAGREAFAAGNRQDAAGNWPSYNFPVPR
jgi:hypothetical protein